MYQQGRKLKKLIQNRGDTQARLAKILNVSKATLSYKLNETNGRALTVYEMQAISEYYNIPSEQREALFF